MFLLITSMKKPVRKSVYKMQSSMYNLFVDIRKKSFDPMKMFYTKQLPTSLG